VVPKSELSSDRAGLLATQDPNAAMRMLISKWRAAADHEADEPQRVPRAAKEYENRGARSTASSRSPTRLDRTHPFNTLPRRQLQRWIEPVITSAFLARQVTRAVVRRRQPAVDKDR